MPLLRRQPFYRQKPPAGLRADEEVFHCKLTNEIFRDYEEFFERIILCNSLVWSCAITGRSGLTYQEAVDSEDKAKKHLATFPSYLQRPILLLASLTHRSRLADLNDDVFVFAKDRYFIGEVVEVLINSERKSCKILKVIPPVNEKINGDVIVIDCDSDSEEEQASPSTSKGAKFGADPDKFQYVVQPVGKSSTVTVKASKVNRKRGLYTRDKSKLFLKHHCQPDMGLWQVKEQMVRKLNLNAAKFWDFFAGPPPSFVVSKIKKKTSPKKLNTPAQLSTVPESPKKKDRKRKEEKIKEKSPKESSGVENPRLTAEERAALKEQIKQEKMAEKMAKREELKKKLEEEKLKRKEEKAKEREKLREEKRLQLEVMKEWSRPRDDLECDDLKLMPEFTPVGTRVPMELFGEAVAILEFVHTFRAMFDFKQFFPKGFTWGMLESAILDHDIDGPLCDLVQMLLVAIFTLQEEEAEEVEELEAEEQEKNNNADKMDNQGEETMDDDLSANQMIQSATVMAQTPQLIHGMPLKKMLLDQFTLTEILRIHLLSSGARASMKNARFRYQQRGGYTSLDDAGLELRMQDPSVIKALGTESLYDLSPGEKIKIISSLIQQISSYAATRDYIEESYEKLRLLKYDLKQMQWAEQRREREEAQARYRVRLEERARERERKLQKFLEREALLKAEENRNGDVNGDKTSPEMKIDKRTKNAKLLIMEDRDTPSPGPDVGDDDDLTPEEREAIRKKEEEEEAKKKADFAQREQEALTQILELQRANAVYPLGRDRLYRRYWMFHSLPGLFVEDNELHVSGDLFDPVSQHPDYKPGVKHIPKLTAVDEKNTSSDKENDSFNTSSLNTSLVNNSSTTVPMTNPRVMALKKSDDDIIVISDSDSDSRSATKDEVEMEVEEPPPTLEEEELPPDSLAAQQITERKTVMWSFLSKSDQLEELLNSLNTRGFREGALKQSLSELKTFLVKAVKSCPVADISLPPDAVEKAHVKALTLTRGINSKKAALGAVKNDTAEETMELNLRDTLLDLEERIYAGSLGAPKIKDRFAWRDAIERGGYDPQTTDPLFAKSETRQKTEVDDDSCSVSSSATPESVIKDLARVLIQISRGIEQKYLGPPLGEDEESKKTKSKTQESTEKKLKSKKDKKDKEDADDSEDEDKDIKSKTQKTTMERWEDSLLCSASLSQIFLHISTLDKCITWSKSALHARCRICRRKGDAEKMLLCDGCDRGHHMYCLKPPVEKVPSGDWYCPICRPKETKRSPRKDRRKTFTEESEEENDESDEEDDEEDDSSEEDSEEDLEDSDEDEDSEEELDPNDNTCTKCNKTGMLLCCDNCPGSYHLHCAVPPLKKVPRGKWMCPVCLGTENKGKIKIGKVSNTKKKKTPAKTTPNSSRPGSRRESPRDSPVPSRSSRKTNHDSDDDTPRSRKSNKSSSKQSHDFYQDMEGTPKQYVSSFRCNTQVQQMKAMEDIVNDLVKQEDSWPFLKPVVKKEVPDYYEVITKPMDFSTIRNKIHKFEYSEPSQLISDVRQIFMNCIEYNNRKTPQYKAGGNLSKIFENKIRDLGIDTQETTPPPSKKSKRS